MRILSRTLVALVCSLALSSAIHAAPKAPTPPPKEYTKSELEMEQRIVRAHIKDAEFNVSRGINAVAADLADSAKVSVLRASGRIAQIEEILKGYPERIERLAFSLFYNRENVRKQLREDLDKMRASFSATEDSMNALRRDMAKKGLFGEELKRQLAVLDSVPNIIKDLEANNPELAAEARALLEEINQALSDGDMAKATGLMKKLDELLMSSGYGSSIRSDPPLPEGPAVGATGPATPATPAAPAGPREVSRRTLPNGAEEVVTEQTVTNPDGSRTVTRTVTVTNPDGSKSVTTITENYDASGALIGRTSETQRFDPSGKSMGTTGASLQGQNLVFKDQQGRERVVPMSFFRGGTTATIYETRYIGGEGAVLTAEREIKMTLKLGTAGEFLGADQAPGKERAWDFVIEEIEGSRTYDANGAMHTRLVLKDNKLKSDYKVVGWTITNAAGQNVGSFGSELEVAPKFDTAGKHTLTVKGETDWGNPFAVTVDIDVAL